MNDIERDSVLKSISIGLGLCAIFSFIIFIFQGLDLSAVIVSYLVLGFMIVRCMRKKFFDKLFYGVYLVVLVFQVFILSYSYLIIPKSYQSGKIQFYIYTGIFIVQIIIYFVLIYYDKVLGQKIHYESLLR